MTNGLLGFPENYPGPIARKDPSPTILETVDKIEAAKKRRWEQGSVRKDFKIALAFFTGLVVFTGCAPAAVEAIATSQPNNTPDGGDATPTTPSIVPLDNPTNIERLFTPTPDAVTVQPTAISPVEIGNYIDDQPRILDEYVVMPPVDLLPSMDGDSIGQESADNLKRMAFVPVSVVGGVDYLSTENGGVGLIPIPNMSTETGDVLTLDAEASAEGDWFVYTGVDVNNEEIVRYSPKYVECKGECATAIWFGKGDKAGTTLIFDMDPDTGEVKGVAQAFYTDKDDKVVFGEFDRSEWSTEISGADAIVFAIDNGAEMAYDPESQTVSFTTEDGENNQTVWADLNDYHYVDEFGTYVDVENGDGGLDRYVEIDGNFVKSERVNSPSDAPVYVLGQRSYIEKDGLVEWVDKYSVDETNGDIIVVNNNKELKWDGNDWVEVMTPAQIEWKNLFENNGYTFALDQVVSPNGVVVEGLHMRGDTLVMTYAFPELGGDSIDITLTDDGIRFGYNLALDTIRFKSDGALDMPGLRFDGEQVVQEKVKYNSRETKENLLPVEVVIELIRRDTAAYVEKYGDGVLADDSDMRKESGARWRELTGVYSLSDRTVPYKGMTFTRAVDGVGASDIFIVDQSGKPILDESGLPEREPTLFYAYQELVDGQSMITWKQDDGTQVWYMVDGFLGNIQYYMKNDVLPIASEK